MKKKKIPAFPKITINEDNLEKAVKLIDTKDDDGGWGYVVTNMGIVKVEEKFDDR